MTVSPAPLPADPDASLSPARRPVLALDGNRAALLLLISQNVGVAGLLRLHLSLGLAVTLAFVITALLALLLLRPALRALVQDSRWRTPPAVWTALGALALGVLASRGVLVFVLSVWPQGVERIQQFQSTGLDEALLIVGAGLLIPFAEELAFRGLLMRGYERAGGPLFAALLSSLIFGLAHGVPAQILAILPIAWVLARAAQHSGSLWTSVIMHALNNAGSLLLANALQGSELMKGSLKQLESLQKLPLQLGLAGLLLAAAAMFAATVWLRPRPDLPARLGGPVFSASLGVLLALIGVVILGQFVPLGTLLGR